MDAQEGERTLEIGFGTGHCILELAQAVGESGKVYGIDLSGGMHAITQQRIEQAGIAGRVELHIGDAAEMPIEVSGLDAVFISFTLELFDTPEIPVVLGKCHSLLRPGGRICVVAMAKRERDNLMVRIYEWFHELAPRYADCRPIFAQASMVAAGFQVRTVKEMSMWGLPVEIVLAGKPA